MDVVGVLGELDGDLIADHADVGADGSHERDEELCLIGDREVSRAGHVPHPSRCALSAHLIRSPEITSPRSQR